MLVSHRLPKGTHYTHEFCQVHFMPELRVSMSHSIKQFESWTVATYVTINTLILEIQYTNDLINYFVETHINLCKYLLVIAYGSASCPIMGTIQ